MLREAEGMTARLKAEEREREREGNAERLKSVTGQKGMGALNVEDK